MPLARAAQTFTAGWSGPLAGVWLGAVCPGCTGTVYLGLAAVQPGLTAGTFQYTMMDALHVPSSTWASGTVAGLPFVPFSAHPVLAQRGVYAVMSTAGGDPGNVGFRLLITTGDQYRLGQLLSPQAGGGCGNDACLVTPTGAVGQDAVFLTQMSDATRQVNDTDPGLCQWEPPMMGGLLYSSTTLLLAVMMSKSRRQ